MKAVFLEQFGEPAKVLSVRDIEAELAPGPGQLRVRMLASPVNPSDLMMIRGVYGKLPKLPATPGFEGVGVVESAGPGLLGKFLTGRRVALLNGETGNWKEFTTVPAKQAVPLSKSIPLEQAAMFFVNPTTAYVMTQKVLQIPAGAWLLQTAAGSALGKMVIRLGRRLGFKTLNIVRRSEQIDELSRLGGDLVLSAGAADLREQVLQHTNGQGVPFAIDPVGGALGSAVVGCLAPGGRMLVYGTLSAEPLQFSPRDLMTPGTSIAGFWLARWMQQQNLLGKLRVIRRVTALMKEGVLVSEVAQSFSLAEIQAAVVAAEAPGKGGKVLLRIAEP